MTDVLKRLRRVKTEEQFLSFVQMEFWPSFEEDRKLSEPLKARITNLLMNYDAIRLFKDCQKAGIKLSKAEVFQRFDDWKFMGRCPYSRDWGGPCLPDRALEFEENKNYWHRLRTEVKWEDVYDCLYACLVLEEIIDEEGAEENKKLRMELARTPRTYGDDYDLYGY